MGYYLQAIIGQQAVLEAHAGDFANARVVPLDEGLALIPMTWRQILRIVFARPLARTWKRSGVDQPSDGHKASVAGRAWLHVAPPRSLALAPGLATVIDPPLQAWGNAGARCSRVSVSGDRDES